jgi:hypothetical protein
MVSQHEDVILVFLFFRVNEVNLSIGGSSDRVTLGVDGSSALTRLGAGERWNKLLRFGTSVL